jgi:uncharacterized protein (UPF0264 family)
MTGLLASVKNLAEARIALAGGADIIDLKNPSEGALGALSLTEIGIVVKDIANRAPISATVGDLPMIPETLAEAVRSTAATGVDYVKIGFFGNERIDDCIAALAHCTQRPARLIAVLFADMKPDWASLLPALRIAGFGGVMLDTAMKNAGSLRSCMEAAELSEFVALARRLNLLSGLAGSLRPEDISPLLELSPNYLGFRTALCRQSLRIDSLDAHALSSVRDSIPRYTPRLAIGHA